MIRHILRSPLLAPFVGIVIGICLVVGLWPFPHSPTSASVYPSVIMEVMDPSLDRFAGLWQAEIGRRFPNSVGILCHGGEFINGEWIVGVDSFGRLGMTADELVRNFQTKYPNRTIVLLSCNPGHLALKEHGVFHANGSVWCVPDRAVGDEENAHYCLLRLDCPFFRFRTTLTAEERSKSEPNVMGNIFEFTAD